VNADSDRLRRIHAGLDDEGRRTLLAFAEFLAARNAVTEPAPPQAPTLQPRAPDESVVAALKRLRSSYPMLAAAPLLDAASQAMTRHMLQGRPAKEVIDELEEMFAAAYSGHVADREEPR